jgi:hypothetical protein
MSITKYKILWLLRPSRQGRCPKSFPFVTVRISHFLLLGQRKYFLGKSGFLSEKETKKGGQNPSLT